MSQNDLSDTFDIKVNGQKRQVFMTYNLLNEIAEMAEGPEKATLAVIDNNLRGKVLGALLATRNGSGKVVEVVDVAELALDRREVVALLGWTAEHVADFFDEGVTMVTDTIGRHPTALAALRTSFPGSRASAGSDPSAGPSDASPASSA